MAVFTINENTFNVTNGNNTHAFDGDSAASDTLTVTVDGYLIALGNNSNGARLANTLAWKVTVNGLIYSQDDDGIDLLAGNTALSTITIGADGEVSGQGATSGGIEVQSPVTVTNAGVVSGASFGVRLEDPATVINSGTISSNGAGSIGIVILTSATTITNSGTISGVDFAIRDIVNSNDKLTNTGTINGSVILFNGTNSVTNSGTINGFIAVATGNDTIINSGTITESVSVGDGANVITNSGTIGQNAAANNLTTGDGNDTLTNTKLIIGNVLLNDGTNKVTNSGTITGFLRTGTGDDTISNTGTIATLAGDGLMAFGDGVNKFTNSKIVDVAEIQFGDGNDTVTNSGTIDAFFDLRDGINSFTNSGIVTGDVLGGAGVDTVKNTGTVNGIFDLGGGNDIFTGGNLAETLRDAAGSDTYKFNAGNDTYLAKRLAGADGTDSVDGGVGIDTYDASGATTGVDINLDTVDHDFSALGVPGAGLVLKNTGTGNDIDGGGVTKDTILNFENAKGGSGGDDIFGSAVANVLEGNGSSDAIFGFGGNDTLIGGAGGDQLIGGVGKDTLIGGVDAVLDIFTFTALSDSTVGKAGRDRIVDFEDGFDVVDLGFIDAIAGGGNDAFTLINADSSVNPAGIFSGVAGQLRTQATATGWMIQGDVNGDKKADFAIDIVDPTHSIVLTVADFVL